MKYDEIVFTKTLNALKERNCVLMGNKKCIGLECGSILAIDREDQKTPGLYCLFSYLMDKTRELAKDHGFEIVSIKERDLFFEEGD